MAILFGSESMRFLRGLTRHNDRAWFEERRPVYEAAVKAPLLGLVEAVNASLDTFAPEFVRPPHKIAMRIFRDVRFSPDKRPYKTNVSAWWAKRGLDKASGAGFYVQIGPDASFLAGGVYAPEREALLALRTWFAGHHEQYRETLKPLLRAKGRWRAMQAMESELLTRNPKGFPPEHPASDLLRAKNWGVTAPLDADVVLSSDLAAEVVAQFQRLMPLVALLNEPLSAAIRVAAPKALF